MVALDNGQDVPATAVQAAVVHTVVACPQPPSLSSDSSWLEDAVNHERWKITAKPANSDADLMLPLVGSRLAELDDTVEFGEPTETVVQTLADSRLALWTFNRPQLLANQAAVKLIGTLRC